MHLQRLTPTCSEPLAIASIDRREFSLRVLQCLASVPHGELLDQLDEALAPRLVTDVPGSRSELRFTHALVRDTLYDELSPGSRRELHRRAAEAIALVSGSSTGAHLSVVAHHYLRALPS